MDGLALTFGTGFGIGLLGSLHCLGMCGPLALALPVHARRGFGKLAGILSYNLGRTSTYTILGGLFGLIGRQFILWGWQQGLSIGAGLLMLLFAFSRLEPASRIPGFSRLTARIGNALSGALGQAHSLSSLFGVGILNGLLPCGLVYVAILAAIPFGSVPLSASVMFGFGLATIPAMAGLMVAGQWIGPGVRRTFNRFIPFVIGILAVLLVLRGLELGIPYVSPLQPDPQEPIMCHDSIG